MPGKKAAPTFFIIVATALCGCSGSSSGAGSPAAAGDAGAPGAAGDAGSSTCGYAACLNKVFAQCGGTGSCVEETVDDGVDGTFISKTCWANGAKILVTADNVNHTAHVVMKNGNSVCCFDDWVDTSTAAGHLSTGTVTDGQGRLVGTYTVTSSADVNVAATVASTCAGSDTVTTLPLCPSNDDQCFNGTCDI